MAAYTAQRSQLRPVTSTPNSPSPYADWNVGDGVRHRPTTPEMAAYKAQRAQLRPVVSSTPNSPVSLRRDKAPFFREIRLRSPSPRPRSEHPDLCISTTELPDTDDEASVLKEASPRSIETTSGSNGTNPPSISEYSDRSIPHSATSGGKSERFPVVPDVVLPASSTHALDLLKEEIWKYEEAKSSMEVAMDKIQDKLIMLCQKLETLPHLEDERTKLETITEPSLTPEIGDLLDIINNQLEDLRAATMEQQEAMDELTSLAEEHAELTKFQQTWSYELSDMLARLKET